MVKAAALLRHNPALLAGIVYANAVSRIAGTPKHPVQKEINGVKFEFDFSLGPQIRQMYFNAYEPLTLAAMKQFLRKGDTFLDVGANMGFIASIAAGIVGKQGQVHCFEPSPADFERLKKLPLLNPDYKIFINPCAAGEKKEIVNMDISNLSWVGWNTLVPNFMRRNACKESVPVEVIRLDDYIRKKRGEMGRIGVIKIDTEGFEFFVLKGLEKFFEEERERPVILCEITPRANGLMGVDMADVAGTMDQYGYHAYSYVNWKTRVALTDLQVQTDVIFLARA